MPKVIVMSELCKSCGLCIAACPKKILAVGSKANQKGYYPITVAEPEKCTGCALCGLMCPDVAIEVYKEASI
ncbi:MAG TPA: 4Fe-4S binding protein [Methylomusa anaerophila]|uniref:2-oxoglutarate-acceptor oxidoreductase subunit OorD n=1 Tax=Methylomusa anaerophila TaxID=1930071 RepID=A0A348AFS5_9FIRM|nr:4Fe-4S binding protein [Methylomusa anaerophila]BBB89923.1 2-oxoglutarate-acceptor oxidoreductase subunit OorD [Methylomusa anaerophila]HML88351.1 4Fe-4S binding protein [Methylomusa anaerophila]